jgi:acyl-coenzyme A synthetase/AMP-(fatty) acid ligase
MCHVGQEFMLLGSLQHGSCTIQPTKITFSPDELMDMIIRCRMNRLNQFAGFLATNIRASRQNPNLLRLLQSLDEIAYTGLPLPQDDEAWAYSQGLRLKVRAFLYRIGPILTIRQQNIFGSTECGAMLLSIGGKERNAAVLRPLEGVSYGFLPIEPPTPSESSHQSTGRMLELVIFAESRDCPDISLRREDGHFHTGDLFQEVLPGHYIARGRDDDWIKSDNGLRCDTQCVPFPFLYRFKSNRIITPDLSKKTCDKHAPISSRSASS